MAVASAEKNKYVTSNNDMLAACARAISRKSELNLIDAPSLYSWLYTTENINTLETDSPQTRRGVTDMVALLHRHHNKVQHQSQKPNHEEAAAAFDTLEHMRNALLGAQAMSGCAQNLTHYFSAFLQSQPYSMAHDAMPLSDAVAFLLWEMLSESPLPAHFSPHLAPWRTTLDPMLKMRKDDLEAVLHDQSLFAQEAKKLIEALSITAQGELTEPEKDPDQQPDAAPGAEETEGEEESGEQETSETQESDESTDIGEESGDRETGKDIKEGEHEGATADMQQLPPARHNQAMYGYHAFTTEFDEVINADKLLDAEELSALRRQLDEKLAAHKAVPMRLANKLRRLLLARQRREWHYDLEDGMLDASRLARLITRADQRDIFKEETESQYRETVVSLLLDNSGSMRGRPITIAAMSADILTRTLERCGVKVEVLGFTTKDWKGGKSRKAWLECDQPTSPGRLNDLRHIIYKAADMPLRRGQRLLAAMLKENLLKENIDGEALLWAHSRLLQRSEQRKIMMVISDGAPVDDATLSMNDSAYLDTHLRGVIEHIEQKSSVELLAIGIGHDVTRYYSNAMTLYDVDKLGEAMLEQCVELFS